MHIKRTLIIGTALAALLLSGCEALQKERQNFLDREEKITNVVGNVWRIEAVWPGHVEGNRLADHLHERARMHCDRHHMAMLPVNGSSTNGTKDGSRPASAWLEFRCQPGLDYRPEYKGLTGTFEIDDLTALENTKACGLFFSPPRQHPPLRRFRTEGSSPSVFSPSAGGLGLPKERT